MPVSLSVLALADEVFQCHGGGTSSKLERHSCLTLLLLHEDEDEGLRS